MITPGDEYPLHQTSRPVRDPGSERNLYDRFFFNGYTRDASTFFAVALGQYPGRNVTDAAFSVVTGGVQHNVRASRILGDDRLDTRVGPIRVEIVEPLRRLRLVVADEASGVAADLTFAARAPVFEEPRYHWQPGYAVAFDFTRLTQSGEWSGTITVGGETLDVGGAWGTRDRSWGVRPVGEREAGAPERAGAAFGFYWLWAPLNLDDECVLFDVNENPDGSRWHGSAMRAPADVSAAVEAGSATYEMPLKPGTRHALAFTLDYTGPSGARRYELEPLCNFYMQGIGYGHPKWGHGRFVGPDERDYDTLVTAEVDEKDFLNQHIQALCRVRRDDGAEGLGILEQLIIGPSATLGLTNILDMAP